MRLDKTSHVENIVAPPERVPRFSLLAGIGGIVVYLTSSIPFILVAGFIKIASLQADSGTLSSEETSQALKDVVKNPFVLVGALVVQCTCLFLYVGAVSWIRGTGNPFRDIGFRFTRSSLFFVAGGAALQIIGLIIGIPLALLKDNPAEQEIVSGVKSAQGWGFFLLMVMVAFVVPVAEEVCFRGLFMRGLAKKVAPTMAILITGALFAVIHLGDPKAFLGLTTLFIFGLVASALAMYRGRLDASICLHIGFNLTTVLFILLTR